MAEEAVMSDVASKDSAPGSAVLKAKPEVSDEEIASLVQRTMRGDPTSISAVRSLLAEGGVGQALVDGLGSSAEWLRQGLVSKAGGKNVLVEEAIRRKIDAVRADLEGPNPTPIERLLAERAAFCWFIVYWYENSFLESDLHQQRIDRAHARFLAAVRTLAQVRKLALPALQVNIAKSQVNVAGGGS
jgi:hypothetical protein